MTPDAETFLCQKRKAKASGYRGVQGIICTKTKVTIKVHLAFIHRNSILQTGDLICTVPPRIIVTISPPNCWDGWHITYCLGQITSPLFGKPTVPPKLHQDRSSERIPPLLISPAPNTPQGRIPVCTKLASRINENFRWNIQGQYLSLSHDLYLDPLHSLHRGYAAVTGTAEEQVLSLQRLPTPRQRRWGTGR